MSLPPVYQIFHNIWLHSFANPSGGHPELWYLRICDPATWNYRLPTIVWSSIPEVCSLDLWLWWRPERVVPDTWGGQLHKRPEQQTPFLAVLCQHFRQEVFLMDDCMPLPSNESGSGWGNNLCRLQCWCLQWSCWVPVQQYCEIDDRLGNAWVNTGEGAKGVIGQLGLTDGCGELRY